MVFAGRRQAQPVRNAQAPAGTSVHTAASECGAVCGDVCGIPTPTGEPKGPHRVGRYPTLAPPTPPFFRLGGTENHFSAWLRKPGGSVYRAGIPCAPVWFPPVLSLGLGKLPDPAGAPGRFPFRSSRLWSAPAPPVRISTPLSLTHHGPAPSYLQQPCTNLVASLHSPNVKD